jgi:uncharacterized protein (TIGR02145 family)
MKRAIAILVAVLITTTLWSQNVPQKMSYQAVIRDASGLLVISKVIGMEINIRQGSLTGTIVYTETQTPTINANGLVSIEIGGGTGFSTINWSGDKYFIETKTAIVAPLTTYTIIGTSQLLSVPYALHAKTAESVSGTIPESDPVYTSWNKSTGISITKNQISDLGTYLTSYTETDPIFGASPANGITTQLISNWNTASSWGDHAGLYRPINYIPEWTEITNKPDFAKWDKDSTDNVIITGNQTIAGNKTFTGTISASNNTITNVASPVNTTDATNKAYVDALQEKINALENSMIISGAYIKDIDGNLYSTVKIGTQVWMAENLKTTKYSNGDLIGTTTPATLDITSETAPKYQWACSGSESNVATYGRLYTFYVVTDTRNVCPIGWHVPSDAEWTTMESYLIANGYNYNGTNTGNNYAKAMASTTGWTTSTTAGAPGNTDYPTYRNKSGFTAVSGGNRFNNGTFINIGWYGYWWSSTENSTTNAWIREVYCSNSNVGRYSHFKRGGYSVRCVRDL